MSFFRNHLKRYDNPIIIFDGGIGTSFQNMNLSSSDFGGVDLEGCNENLVLSFPSANSFADPAVSAEIIGLNFFFVIIF